MIDVEIIDAPLDYNLLIARSFLYAMKAVTSLVFFTMSFTHNGKIVTIDKLTYYDPRSKTSPRNFIYSMVSNKSMPSLTKISLGVYKYY